MTHKLPEGRSRWRGGHRDRPSLGRRDADEPPAAAFPRAAVGASGHGVVAGARLDPVDGVGGTTAGGRAPALTACPVVSSIEELIPGASGRRPFRTSDAKSGSSFERVEIDGERYVLKVMHVDDDWLARSMGDITCRPVRVWAAGLLEALPPTIDHTVVGAATGLGRHGWGAALLMRDVGDRLVPAGDQPVPSHQHAAFLDHLAELSARFWGWTDTVGLTPPSLRWAFFGDAMLDVERRRGWPDEVPRIAAAGWEAFADRAPHDVERLVSELRRAPWTLDQVVATTPTTFLHGDWKMGNLGSHADGRTILIDCAYPGEGPACHELGWYLAINRARLPESKEAAIERFRASLERHGVATADWWERQLDVCLLGTLVQFGWEKALGDGEELAWWSDRARAGARWL
jgi:Phosphotransferase enzyme family